MIKESFAAVISKEQSRGPSKRRFELQSYQINYIKKRLGISKIEDIDKAVLKQLKENLKKVKDIRMQHKTKFKI